MVFLFLAALLQTPPDFRNGEESAVELRAMGGYLGLYAAAQKMPSSDTWREEIRKDLQVRLEKFLDRPDLTPPVREEAIEIYHQLARTLASQGLKHSVKSLALREVYSRLIQRAETAGQDSLRFELEMLSTPGIGLGPQETYSAIARMMPGLSQRPDPLPGELSEMMKGVLRRILAEPGWPDLESGDALTRIVQLLLKLKGSDRTQDGEVIAKKLEEWTARLLKAEAAREGEMAQEEAIIHLYRSLEMAGRLLNPEQRTAALKGLLALEPPALVEGPQSPKPFRKAEIGEVRLPAGTRRRIPPLSYLLAAGTHSRYLLVPGKSYQVKLICSGQGPEPRSIYWVLARAGPSSRLMLPRSIPDGMVPITLAESGRIGFLADRKPWSIRKFLLAFQRCGNSLVADRDAVLRIYKQTALREISLGEGESPTFAALVQLLSNPALKRRLDEIFWVDSRDRIGRAVAFEIANAVLNSNTGLRDTGLVMPTVSEANRLRRQGELFGIEDHQFGIFNAIQLIPKPEENPQRSRYVVRTVLQIASP